MNIDELIKKLEREGNPLDEKIASDAGMEKLRQVASEYNGEYRLVWTSETLKEIESEPKRETHTTNNPAFDDITGGFKQQQMIGIGAQSGHGKTAFGLWLLEQYKHLNPLFIPLEQSSRELIEQRQDNGQFVPEYLSPRKHTAFVDPEWIEMRIAEAVAKYNSKLVMIDHMGYVNPSSQYQREADHIRIEKKLQEINFLAEKWDVVIILLIQLTQMEEHETPQLRNLKGSSAIRQECAKVLFLWRNNTRKGKANVYDNKVLLSMQKNRSTGINKNAGAEFDFKTGNYNFTPAAQEWVANLETRAKEDLHSDDAF